MFVLFSRHCLQSLTMGTSHLFLTFHLFISIGIVTGEEGETLCKTPQYVEYGKTGVLHCEFEEDFYAVYWYNSTDVISELPILRFENFDKSGTGFDSGEFDIHQNGSLIIKEVTLEHDHTFSVIYVKTKETPTTIDVRVIVTIKPAIPHPVIDKCQQDLRSCFTEMHERSAVSCLVQNVRPNIDLYWLIRDSSDDRNISSGTSVAVAENGTFTSKVTTSSFFNQSQLLVLLICKAVDLSDLLENDESAILVQNNNISISTVQPKAVQAMSSSKLELHCAESKVSSIVWKRQVSDGSFDNVAIAFGNEKIITDVYKESFMIGQQNSLVISNVRVEHEGVYACIHNGDEVESIKTFDISVAVLPEPSYPLVNGCVSQYCTKNVEFEGRLNCEVKGIRPKVSLEWRVLYAETSSKINFGNQQLTTNVSSNGDTFDVSVTSEYSINDASQRRLTVECVVIGVEFQPYEMSTIVDLLFQDGTVINPTADTVEPRKGSLAWMVVFLIPVIVMISVASYFVFRKKKPRKRETHIRQSDLEEKQEQETEPLYHTISEDPYTETDGRQRNNEMEKLNELRKCLLEEPTLDDICQVPTLFIKFLTITGQSGGLPKFNTVTNMYKHVISRFFSNKRSEITLQEDQSEFLVERDHHKLDRLAFLGLLMASKGNEMMWSEEKACQEIGKDLYHECIKLGILVQSEGLYDDQLEVRFYDKLLCQWYAAHYFSYRVSVYGREDAQKFLGFDPCEHHYFYRFSCGLHLSASEEVKKYLTNLPNGIGDRLTILCDLEETGNLDTTKQTLEEFFQQLKYVEIRQKDNKVLRMSTLQLCEMGYSLGISVPPLWLMECFVEVDNENGILKIKNRLTVKLEIFKEVRIEDEKKELTEENVCQILELAAKSETLENFVFWRCLVPESLQESKGLLASLQKANFKVKWLTKPGEFYALNFQTGHWEMLGEEELKEEKYAEEDQNISGLDTSSIPQQPGKSTERLG